MNKVNLVAKYVNDKLANDKTGHNIDHIQRVVKMAKLILQSEPAANAQLTIVSAYLHDVIDDKLVDSVEIESLKLRLYLIKCDFSNGEIDDIFNIINNMSFSKNLKFKRTLSLEGQIVQDADRLDAIGAIGIARAFYYGGHFGDVIYDENERPRTLENAKQYRKHTTIINHFYEKLLKISHQMNTKTAIEIAARRTQYMQDFLKEFKLEYKAKR
ncbi:HD domain protein [Apilactobacillus ozensis DSM 23829 = JCM 17196]|uniref:HD domain protein n=1 Tax=Apilactobacillus ozensis DSM 23829 = JCM 17196 TaxID=1423781 RepID=A0A0R2ASY8_9LACO|nr:HD domain-containing protein [Apilactobacillus ozensis]KRM69706.1 HD domain protein [Apilactobacillus ozensis DSM 23829 = JCM 17196]